MVRARAILFQAAERGRWVDGTFISSSQLSIATGHPTGQNVLRSASHLRFLPEYGDPKVPGAQSQFWARMASLRNAGFGSVRPGLPK